MLLRAAWGAPAGEQCRHGRAYSAQLVRLCFIPPVALHGMPACTPVVALGFFVSLSIKL